MNNFNTSENNSIIYFEEKLKNETDDKFLNLPTSLNGNLAFSSLDFQKIEPSYFLTNNLNNSSTDDKGEHIIFEREHDKNKFEKKKVFLFDLSEEQKVQVENFKIRKIMQNEMYLKKNKVLKYIIHIFLCDILKEKPDDVYEYAANYFTQPNLKQSILQKLKSMLTKS
ncbi:hypothetical protein MKS88_004980 [Plasmodium brasilianum]|uniref:RIIa domain-containing protein n=2 Tax=Plasmodium (Plasmodium) TaxID=418103 RepID=A0A1D3TCU6_PLAMA|nr:conserved Plasmodium protein, unknown function [Plasmodium malariae]KAI4835763.1 hypothetical protein MKS88_004980 [Plasmodium brasilianum]SCP02699.1 conserved Plasmodium protein, unknown function [Plasmodium malariae]